MVKKQLLVIDHNPYHFEILMGSLSQFPQVRFQITRALNMEQGILMLKSRRYDLVLTENFSMEEGEWIATLSERSQGTPIVILTSQRDDRQAIDAIRLGASDYLLKNKQTLDLLPYTLLKAIEKRKKKFMKPKTTPLDMLSKNIKSLTSLLNEPAKKWAGAGKQINLAGIKNEIKNIKKIIKNIVLE